MPCENSWGTPVFYTWVFDQRFERVKPSHQLSSLHISLLHCCSAAAVHFTHIEFLNEEGY